jgi:antitoxin VapB
MATARVFKSGNSQAVRLPKEFRFSGSEVEIFRRGEEVVLVEKPRGMERVFDLIASLPEDMFDNIKDERPPEEREVL